MKLARCKVPPWRDSAASWLSVLAFKETYRKLDGATLTGEPTYHVRRIYLLAPELWSVLVYEWFGRLNVSYTVWKMSTQYTVPVEA